MGGDGGEDVRDGKVDADDTGGHDEGFVCLRGREAMRGKDGVPCFDHVPGMLGTLLTGDSICTTAVHDDGARSSTRFLEDVAGDKDWRGTECIEGKARSSRGRVRRS